MKKKLLRVSMMVSVATFIGIYGWNVNSTSETSDLYANNLLFENVEALSQGVEESGDTKCGTKIKEYSASQLIKCPICGTGTGFQGFVYSYQKKGNESTYKDGTWGHEYACTPYHGSKTFINTVQIRKCS